MTVVVVDASVALSWLLASQATAAAVRFLRDYPDAELSAPAVFEWEVKNVLVGALRSGRMNDGVFDAHLAQLDGYAIALEPPENADATLHLARSARLSLFDAAYLKLALNYGRSLASKDTTLIAAARARGVVVHDLRDAKP